MKSKTQLLVTAWMILIAGMLFSCKKENSVQETPVTESEAQIISEENASADAEYDDVTEIGLSTGADLETAAEAGGAIPGSAAGSNIDVRTDFFTELSLKLGPCTKITVSPNDGTFPKTVTINYGDGCICRDGKFRKGAVIFHYSAPIRRPGAVLKVTFRNFYVNRVHIQGVKTVKNLSENGVHKFSVTIENGKITWPNGRGFSYDGIKVVTQVRGMETRTVRDDVYELEGRSKTVYANGVVVVKNTETPLIKKVSCPWIVKGILKIKINDRVLFIDFGNGDCDNKAILKWSAGEKEITLP